MGQGPDYLRQSWRPAPNTLQPRQWPKNTHSFLDHIYLAFVHISQRNPNRQILSPKREYQNEGIYSMRAWVNDSLHASGRNPDWELGARISPGQNYVFGAPCEATCLPNYSPVFLVQKNIMHIPPYPHLIFYRLGFCPYRCSNFRDIFPI